MTKYLQSPLCSKVQDLPFPVCEGMNPVIASALLALPLVRLPLAKQIFNILDPNASGKSFGLF